LLHALLNPNVAFLLLNLGFLGLVAELFHPGALVPALAGVIALVLALVGLGTLPLNGGALLLLLLGLGLFYADAHVAGHGALSLAGLSAFVFGGLLLFSPVDARPWEPGPIAVSPWLVTGLAALFAGYFLVVVRAALGASHAVSPRPSAPAAGARAASVPGAGPAGGGPGAGHGRGGPGRRGGVVGDRRGGARAGRRRRRGHRARRAQPAGSANRQAALRAGRRRGRRPADPARAGDRRPDRARADQPP